MTNITNLPVELVAAILAQVDDLCSIPRLLVSHHVFYNAYKEYQASTSLVGTVLHNQFTSNQLALAVAVLQSEGFVYSSSTVEQANAVTSLLQMLFQQPDSLISVIDGKPWEALKLARLKNMVDGFVEEYIQYSFNKLPKSATMTAINDAERNRVCEAMYRAQLYMHCFRDLYVNVPDMGLGNFRGLHRAQFLHRLAPWEIEGVVSIMEWFEHKLGVAGFNEITAHDISPNSWRCSDRTVPGSDYIKQALTGRGIEFLHTLQVAKYQDKLDLVKDTANEVIYPLRNINKAIRRGRWDSTVPANNRQNTLMLRELHEQDLYATFLTTRKDMDTYGYGWMKVNWNKTIPNVLYNPKNACFRKRGYVFWSLERLKLCESTFEEINSWPDEDMEWEERPSEEECQKIEESVWARKQIYRSGGTGYWKEDDPSGIQRAVIDFASA